MVELENEINGRNNNRKTENGQDIRALKTALNKLNFYMPQKGKGITVDADEKFFQAIRDFQRAYFLPVEDVIDQDSLIVQKLNEELENPTNFQLFKGNYIWRTADDKNVRNHHAIREGVLFDWKAPPDGGHPGEDYGCRCWAEPIMSMTPKGLHNGYNHLMMNTSLDAINPTWSPLDFIGGGVAGVKVLIKLAQSNIKNLSKKQIGNIETLRGLSFKQVEKLADNTFLKQGWKKEPLKRGNGWRYNDGKGNTFRVNQGYKGNNNVHGGPYIRYVINGKEARIPLKGNPIK